MNVPIASAIIVTYNPGETILSCLRALPPTVKQTPIEVIVVDNASQDGTVARLKEKFPQAYVLANTNNQGYGAGNNRGFALSSGEFVIILNPDVVVRERALDRLVHYLQHNPNVGIVGPKTYGSDNQPVITARHEYTVRRLLAKYLGLNTVFSKLVYGSYGNESLKCNQPMDVDWLHGSALVIRRELYEELGGFDEQFFLFMEDVDICMRAKEAGWRVVYVPQAEVEHVGSESVSRHHLTRIRSYHISPLYYYRKRRQAGAVRMLKAGFVVSLFLKSILRRARNLFKPNASQLEKARVEMIVIKEVVAY